MTTEIVIDCARLTDKEAADLKKFLEQDPHIEGVAVSGVSTRTDFEDHVAHGAPQHGPYELSATADILDLVVSFGVNHWQEITDGYIAAAGIFNAGRWTGNRINDWIASRKADNLEVQPPIATAREVRITIVKEVKLRKHPKKNIKP